MRQLSRIASVTVLIVVIAVAAGCGKSNPAAPTAPTTSATSGATIQGTVLGGSVSARSADSTGGSMTVSVVGTNITVSVSLTGQFTITGVPAGDIRLKFHGVSGDAEIQVTQVTQGETITLTITIQGTVATKETETRQDSQNMTQVEGRIEAIDTTANAIVVAGKTILFTGNPTIRHGSTPYTFADLTVGWRVHVAGTPGSGGVVANMIEVQNTNGDIQVTVNGTVLAFQGTAAAFQFTVDGQLVKGDSATSFTGKSTFADVKDGARVEVKGQQKNGYVYAKSIKVN